jgi:hypothetical protein
MAIGTTMLALTLLGIGTGTQAVGQVRAGKAAKKAGEAQQAAAESQADLADFNADVADVQAADALARGRTEESRFRSQVRSLIGSQRAGFAASNVDVGFGSAVDVTADAARLGELDALTIRTNAAREAWGYEVSATDLRHRAQIARKEGVYQAAAGREQQTSYNIAAAGTVLGGAGSLLMNRYGFGSRSTA